MLCSALVSSQDVQDGQNLGVETCSILCHRLQKGSAWTYAAGTLPEVIVQSHAAPIAKIVLIDAWEASCACVR